jgi:hypothetical protein
VGYFMNLAKRLVLLLAVPLAALLVLGAILDLQLRNRGAAFEDVWLASPERQTGAGVNLWSPKSWPSADPGRVRHGLSQVLESSGPAGSTLERSASCILRQRGGLAASG